MHQLELAVMQGIIFLSANVKFSIGSTKLNVFSVTALIIVNNTSFKECQVAELGRNMLILVYLNLEQARSSFLIHSTSFGNKLQKKELTSML